MKQLRRAGLILILTVVCLPYWLSAAEEGKVQPWPWQLYASRTDALKVTGFGDFKQTQEDQYESASSTFLGKKAVTTLLFDRRGLAGVRVDVYQGKDKAEALDAWCRLFAWQKARNGEVETFSTGIPRQGDDTEVRKKTEEWLASKPADQVVKLYTNCFEKSMPGRFITFLARSAEGYFVCMTYRSR